MDSAYPTPPSPPTVQCPCLPLPLCLPPTRLSFRRLFAAQVVAVAALLSLRPQARSLLRPQAGPLSLFLFSGFGSFLRLSSPSHHSPIVGFSPHSSRPFVLSIPILISLFLLVNLQAISCRSSSSSSSSTSFLFHSLALPLSPLSLPPSLPPSPLLPPSLLPSQAPRTRWLRAAGRTPSVSPPPLLLRPSPLRFLPHFLLLSPEATPSWLQQGLEGVERERTQDGE